MLFNSLAYICLFLPLVIITYFLLNKARLTIASKVWLVLSSLFFYGWWNPKYLYLLIISITLNFTLGSIISNSNFKFRKALFVIGILLNLSAIGYYKYYDFFISNINSALRLDINLLHALLPLGISFFTFTQIAYLIDSYRQEAIEYDFINYTLFVTFFPHLIAGPILHHRQMMPQFANQRNKVVNHRNLSKGLFLFAVGLTKKVVLADSLSQWVANGFNNTAALEFFESWTCSILYSMQLYFDFSGYSDMALGSALMLNINMPINFASPYLSHDIREFWRRWHITLSTFLRDYVYIPLGGSRVSSPRVYMNLMIAFLLCGLWHGAGYTFIVWGLMHGIALCLNRLWSKGSVRLPKLLSWFITINFINLSWVVFRANSLKDAINIYKGMLGFNGIALPEFFNRFAFMKEYFEFGMFHTLKAPKVIVLWVTASLLIVLVKQNSNTLKEKFQPSFKYLIITTLMLSVGLLLTNKPSEFLYFNF